MNLKRVGAVTLFAAAAAALVIGSWVQPFTTSPTARAAPGPAGEEIPAPGGLKKGVTVYFSATRSPFRTERHPEGFMVEDVQGSWVRLKGEPFEGAPWREKEISAWINFRNVDWYKVKE